MYRRARCTLSTAFYGRARIVSRRRENHTASTTMYCTVQTTLPTVDPLYKKKYNSILGDRIMPCSGTAGASRITNANEGSTLPITTMQRIANFFPDQWGEAIPISPTHPGTALSSCSWSPQTRATGPSATTNGFHVTKLSTSRVPDSASIHHHHHYHHRRGDRRKRSSREMGLSW